MIKYLPVEMIILYHDKLIESYGGLPGIRDMGLLLSAIDMPKMTMFGSDLHPTIEDKAAAYLFHIVCNHPFYDANKRTGAFSAAVFLELNEKSVDWDDSIYEELVLKVAKGNSNKTEIADFFKSKVKSL